MHSTNKPIYVMTSLQERPNWPNISAEWYTLIDMATWLVSMAQPWPLKEWCHGRGVLTHSLSTTPTQTDAFVKKKKKDRDRAFIQTFITKLYYTVTNNSTNKHKMWTVPANAKCSSKLCSCWWMCSSIWSLQWSHSMTECNTRLHPLFSGTANHIYPTAGSKP